MRKSQALAIGVAGLTIGGIVFASSASADSVSASAETTAATFAEAGGQPDKLREVDAAPMYASFLKKAAGSFVGGAAYDYIKASNAIPKREGAAFRRGDVGVDVQSEIDLSRSFDQ
ncbi:hypothetical protein ACFQ7B_30080 [Streptomyces erythrochromogenes]|uniref:hypothetical protein n=1 Tax=Streptomyces erythrochromogenes TaxID=285574 RepID=UPI003681A77B